MADQSLDNEINALIEKRKDLDQFLKALIMRGSSFDFGTL